MPYMPWQFVPDPKNPDINLNPFINPDEARRIADRNVRQAEEWERYLREREEE